MQRKNRTRLQIGMLAATASLVLQFPAYANPGNTLATPSEAVQVDVQRAAGSDAALKLAEYQREGVLLTKDNQNLVDNYIAPLVYSHQNRAVLIGEGFYPYSYKLVYSISYQHEHQFIETEVPATCLLEGLKQKICEICEYSEDTVTARLGHVDKGGDSICDRCGSALSTDGIGTVLSVETGLAGDFKTMEFVCIDDDYQGGRLFLSKRTIPYGLAPGYGKGKKGGDYTGSSVRRWLNDSFFENLSTAGRIKKVTLPESADVSGDYVFCLSKEEVSRYGDEARKPWQAGGKDSYYWTRTQDEALASYAYCVSEGGHVASRAATDRSGGVRPAFVLEGADEGESQDRIYLEGDVQERQLNGQTYRFRCVDSDYADAQGNHLGALFLCDSIIGGNEIVFDREGKNSWAVSSAREWLWNRMENRTDLAEVDTTVGVSFSGKTINYGNSLAMGAFTGTPLLEEQIVETKDTVFCISLEEAIRYQKYLWKLDGSAEDNFTNAGTYTSGYWLRTPGAFDHSVSYCVSYDGQIMTSRTDNESVGVRPAYVIKQK